MLIWVCCYCKFYFLWQLEAISNSNLHKNIKFCSTMKKIPQVKFGPEWPSAFSGETIWMSGKALAFICYEFYKVHKPSMGAYSTWTNFQNFHKHILEGIWCCLQNFNKSASIVMERTDFYFACIYLLQTSYLELCTPKEMCGHTSTKRKMYDAVCKPSTNLHHWFWT